MIRVIPLFTLALAATSLLHADDSEIIKVRALDKASLDSAPIAIVAHRYFSDNSREDIPEGAATLIVLNEFETTKLFDPLYRDLLLAVEQTQLAALAADARKQGSPHSFPPKISIQSMRFSTSNEIEITAEISLGRQHGGGVTISEIEAAWTAKRRSGEYSLELTKQSAITFAGAMY